MDTTAYVALSRQVALQRQMTEVATNIANAATSGYKAEHTLFETVLQRAGPPRRVAFVQDVGLVRDLRDGPLVATGNPLDLAISGAGYFSVATPNGPRFTRGGHFELDARGELVTADGHPVLDEGGAPIAVPPGERRITVTPEGIVAAGRAVVGRLGIVSFADEQALRREGAGLYATDEAPQPVAWPNVVQGRIEGSNVQPVVEMTRMIETTRAFEGTQRLVEAHHELERRAIERLGSVSA